MVYLYYWNSKNTKKNTKNINELFATLGINRKSVNDIMRDIKIPVEGIIPYLYFIRVAPRIGLCDENNDRNKVVKQVIQILIKEI